LLSNTYAFGTMRGRDEADDDAETMFNSLAD